MNHMQRYRPGLFDVFKGLSDEIIEYCEQHIYHVSGLTLPAWYKSMLRESHGGRFTDAAYVATSTSSRLEFGIVSLNVIACPFGICGSLNIAQLALHAEGLCGRYLPIASGDYTLFCVDSEDGGLDVYDHEEQEITARVLDDASQLLDCVFVNEEALAKEITPGSLEFYIAVGDIEQVDSRLDSSTARQILGQAIRRNQASIALLIVNEFPESLSKPNKNGHFPIHEAVGSVDMLRLLLKAGAELGVLDSLGRTVAHHSVSGGNSRSQLAIIEAGGDVMFSSKDQSGITAIDLSMQLNPVGAPTNAPLHRLLYRNATQL